MKKFLIFISILISILDVQINMYAQQHRSVLVVFETTDYAALSKIPELRVYFHDEDFIFGEVNDSDMASLKSSRVKFNIIDENGWSGDYFLVQEKKIGNRIDDLSVGKRLYRRQDKAIVKIDLSEEADLIHAGFQLVKLTSVDKPLPAPSVPGFEFPVDFDPVIQKYLDQVSQDSMRASIQRLQDFVTRYTYSDSILPAGQWIFDQYKKYGYTDVKFDSFFYHNEYHRNVVATKPGLIYPDSVIMIGGHYDSIIRGGSGNPFDTAPGAEDNGSGTVSALESARILAGHDFEATLKFVAWDAEEVGLVGASAYADEAAAKNEPISIFINFDMIGYQHPADPLRDFIIYTNEPSRPFAQLLADMATTYTTLLAIIPGNSGGSDHVPFQQNGYRAIFGFEGQYDFSHNPNYHMPTDLVQNMDFDFYQETVQSGLATIIYLAGPAEDLDLGPYVKQDDFAVDDDAAGASRGNGNGFIDAGETIELLLTVKNYGDSTANGVTVQVATADPLVEILNNSQTFGSIESQGTSTSADGFLLQIDETTESGHSIRLDLAISDSKGNHWSDRIKLAVTMPDFIIAQQTASQVQGNGDDKIDPGETFNLMIDLENTGLRAGRDIISILRCEAPTVTILDSTAAFSNIATGSLGSNAEDALTLSFSENTGTTILPFMLLVTEGSGYFQKSIQFNLAVGQGKILLVEDDGATNLAGYYKNILESLGIPFRHWETGSGPIPADTLEKFSRVVWYTGREFSNSLYRYGTGALQHYLNQGGRLFLNGSLLAFSLRDSSFLSDYLFAKYVSFNTGLHHLVPHGATEILGATHFWLSREGDNSQSLKGEIDPLPPAQPLLFYDTAGIEGSGNILSSGTGALAVDGNHYRAVLFAFGWEGIANEDVRQSVFINVMNWLQGDFASAPWENENPASLPDNFDLKQNYPNPFNPATTITFDVPSAGNMSLKIFNLLGQEIKTLVDAKMQAGRHTISWDGTDARGRNVSCGVYLYQLQAENYQKTRKMVLLF
ncbi:MAG: M28 family peptidase [Candidatus Zhuqueibacterota bacterium]